MIRLDENALICDLAETYNIHDYKQIAPNKVAIFAIGLKDESRIKMKLIGQKYDFKTLMMAQLVDSVNLLVWSNTKDASKGLNKPESILKHLHSDKKSQSGFATGKDYESAKAMILAGRSV